MAKRTDEPMGGWKELEGYAKDFGHYDAQFTKLVSMALGTKFTTRDLQVGRRRSVTWFIRKAVNLELVRPTGQTVVVNRRKYHEYVKVQ